MRFDSYHPAINLIYFTAAIGLTIWFDHPVYLAISYLCAFVWSVRLKGKKALIFNFFIIPFAMIYAFWYAYYNHFGVTPLKQNIVGNQITLEALMYGLRIGFTAAAVIMLFSCVFAVVSSDKIVYLFGRISPKLSLFLSIMLRTVPRIKEYGRRVNRAQMGIGKSPSQGSLPRRCINGLRMISILITWFTENFVESAMSMKCRGYSLKGRTAFSIYRFDNRDRAFVTGMFALLTVVMIGWILDQTHIYYDPVMIFPPLTVMSHVFFTAYGAFMLMPLISQTIGERRFEAARKNI